VKVGITLPQIGEHATKEKVINLSKNAEKQGFDSLWVLERLVWPLKPMTPYPGTKDGSLPTHFQNVFDPLELLSFVAANTEKISLGTAVIDMFYHNPVILARAFATLDILSNGRVIGGLGIGSLKDEYQVTNIPFKDRGKRADKFLQALESIWTDDVIEFKGEFYNIPASKIGPKPIQNPHPPIYLGGFSPNTFRRIVNYDAEGWVVTARGSIQQIENGIEILRDEAIKTDKDPNKFKVIVIVPPHIISHSDNNNDNENQSKDKGMTQSDFSGTIEKVGIDLQILNEIGVDHVVFSYHFLPQGGDMEEIINISKELALYAK
jgi:probable F420-dependent oxidoreductase